MGRTVYISDKDRETYEILRSICQQACEAGGMLGKDYEDIEGHEKVLHAIDKLTAKINGYKVSK